MDSQTVFPVLPIPTFFQLEQVSEVWPVPYQQRAIEAQDWAQRYAISAARSDGAKTCLLLIDVQNTFCLPEFELFVGGSSGRGAIEDNQRLCEFIYRNLAWITEITVTMDTHYASQIFHPVFWVDPLGNHPDVYTQITLEDVRQEKWGINPAIANSLSRFPGNQSSSLTKYVTYYVQKLELEGKYPLTIWPYHSMLGGIGHSLVSSVEEALFFHNLARHSQTRFEIKGNNPLTENYSVLSPEVLEDGLGGVIAEKNQALIDYLLDFDRVLIAGQAKSHCVAWTVSDLLAAIQARDSAIAKKVYLLEDCTSPVVIPGVVDFSEQANTSFTQFAAAGMHRVQSTTIVDYLS